MKNLDEKSYENILIYGISYKKFIVPEPLHTRFSKLDRSVRVYDGTRYLVLFNLAKLDVIYYAIRYLIGLKSGIANIFSYNFGKVRINSDDDLPRKDIDFAQCYSLSQFLIKINVKITNTIIFF